MGRRASNQAVCPGHHSTSTRPGAYPGGAIAPPSSKKLHQKLPG